MLHLKITLSVEHKDKNAEKKKKIKNIKEATLRKIVEVCNGHEMSKTKKDYYE